MREPAQPEGDPLLGLSLVVVVVIVVFAVCTLRMVSVDHRLVVQHRHGRTRARGPGLVVVWPPGARCVEVPLVPRTIRARRVAATTGDGVEVTVEVTATSRVTDPVAFAGPHGTAPDAAARAAERAIEAAVRGHIAAHPLATLAAAPVEDLAVPNALATEWGLELDPVSIQDMAVRLDRGLLHWARTTADERT